MNFMPYTPGELVGFCWVVETNPRGCPRGSTSGKANAMISASLLLLNHAGHNNSE